MSRFNRTIKQRNAWLKNSQKQANIDVNDDAFLPILAQISEQIAQKRQNILSKIEVYFREYLDFFSFNYSLEISTYLGWSKDKGTFESMKSSFELDLKNGYTHYGAHRFNFEIMIQKQSAGKVLSRGEQKIINLCLFLSQVKFLYEVCKKKSLLLLDDLSSELSERTLFESLDVLLKQNSQIVFTALKSPQIEFVEFSSFQLDNHLITKLN